MRPLGLDLLPMAMPTLLLQNQPSGAEEHRGIESLQEGNCTDWLQMERGVPQNPVKTLIGIGGSCDFVIEYTVVGGLYLGFGLLGK